MKVKDCMCTDVCCVKPETKISDIAKIMCEKHIGSVPVCDSNDCLCGIVTDRDIILRTVACEKDLRNTQVSDIMTKDVCACHENEEMEKAQNKMANNKIRIRLKSFDHKILDASAEKIITSAKKSGAQVVGPVPLPTEKEIYTILRAVHKYKDSREQFEIRTHKRLIEIVAPNKETIDSLQRLELPSGVDIEIKL